MKEFFRYLSGEINGFYLKTIHDMLNSYTGYIKDELMYLNQVQFKLDKEDVKLNEIPMKEEDIRGIAKIAGVFNQFVSAESNLGSLVFTNSKIVQNNQYSDRGLFDIKKEAFKFVRTTQDIYASDIVTLSSPTLRASFVPEGTPIVGYIAEDAVFFDEYGNVNLSIIQPNPPSNKAYYPFYGLQFLHLAELFLVEAYLDIYTFKKLFEIYQYIRYNGPNIASLLEASITLCKDYIIDIHFETVQNRIVLYYRLNQESELENKIKKLFVWRLFVRRKFKTFVLSEVIT